MSTQQERHNASRRKERDFSSFLLAVTLDSALVGRRIADARRKRGWTQLDFAYEAKVSPSSVQRWERGDLPRVKTLMQLADLLEVQVDQLVEPDDRNTAPTASYAQVMAELAELRGMVARLLQEDEGRHPDEQRAANADS